VGAGEVWAKEETAMSAAALNTATDREVFMAELFSIPGSNVKNALNLPAEDLCEDEGSNDGCVRLDNKSRRIGA
jgi:hypothetical protein